ncbi:MAG: tetratricopeptide repeat protein [Nodularia sp. (in: Bacteria)]|nr:MAG: tetratricopeptide repeat protein [Nodularia sp. (in: cyanobacteria)]
MKTTVLMSADFILAKLNINPNSKILYSQVTESELDDYISIINWIKNYKPNSNAQDIDQVKGYTEAIYYLCTLQKFQSIEYLLSINITIVNNSLSLPLSLSEYLLFRGLERQLMDVCDEIIDYFLNTENNLTRIYMLRAKAQAGIANTRQAACDFFQELCVNIDKSSEYYIEAAANLAIAQVYSGEYKQGREKLYYYLNELGKNSNSSKNITDIKSDILEHLAWIAINSSNFKDAIHFYNETIEIREEYGLLHKLISPLLHQGVIQRKLKNYDKAVTYLEKAKEIAQAFGTERQTEWVEHHLAYVLLNQGKYNLAESLCLSCIDRAIQEQGSSIYGNSGIPDYYEQLGLIKLAQRKIDEAIKYLEMSRDLRMTLHNKHGVASSLQHLSIALWNKKNYIKSIKTFCTALKLFNQMRILNMSRFWRTINLVLEWTIGKRRKTM